MSVCTSYFTLDNVTPPYPIYEGLHVPKKKSITSLSPNRTYKTCNLYEPFRTVSLVSITTHLRIPL